MAGKDTNPGTEQQPWKSLAHAVNQLNPGDTLYRRGGIYYEHVQLTRSGKADLPITLRSYPGELAVIDGGLREFFESPATAWEPCPGGADGEYRSTRVYPDLGGRAKQTNLLGNFADSMVPLHGYRFLTDLQSDNPFWNLSSKVADEQSVYCGPGIYYDTDSQRIHVRLAPTRLSGLGEDNYRGESDPRKLPLVIAGFAGGPVLALQDCSHLRLQDLVLRGSREPTLDIHRCHHIELDGLTLYGGSSAARIRETQYFRMKHTACRGIAAPRTFRGSLKYRAIEARILSASHWEPSPVAHHDFEFAYCEFTTLDGPALAAPAPLRAAREFIVAGQSHDRGLLVDAPISEGRLIYVGWLVSGSLPHGRKPSTVEMESNYEAQMKVLTNLAESLTQPVE